MKKKLTKAVFVFLIGLAGSGLLRTKGFPGQQSIELIKALDNSTSISEIETKALQEAGCQAVLQQAIDLIPFSLPEKRRDVLHDYFVTSANNFILTYAMDVNKLDSSRIELRYTVFVNEQSLKKRLKQLGTYFTSKKKIEYSLQVSGFSTDIWQEILQLENLSGLERGDVQFPLLKLQYGQDTWTGILRTSNKSWSTKSSSLSSLWENLWAHFFMLPQTQKRFLSTLFVQVQWWTTSTGLETFNNRLHNWSKVLDQTSLKRVDFSVQGIESQWKIETMNIHSLKEQLQNTLTPRGLELSYSTDSFD